MSDAATPLLEPAPHEYSANFIFDAHGLDPWFAADSIVKSGDGSVSSTVRTYGETWTVKLSYSPSGLAPPAGGETPGGTLIEHETLREFRLKAVADDDVGERKVTAHIAPRWQGLKSQSGKEVNVPIGLGDAVNVSVRGSNVDFSAYPDLLPVFAAEVDLNPRYFDPSRMHSFSNLQDAGKYSRVEKKRAGPIHARSGPIARMGHLLENDRSGYRKIVQNDSDGRGNNLPGYYHTATLGPERVRALIPDHDIPKEVKHYYAREAESFPTDHPLHHPKLEASYQASRWDRTLHPVDDLEQLERELDETILATLADAGLPTRPPDDGNGPFVPDEYFSVDESARDRSVPPLNLELIEQEDTNIVVRHLGDGLTPIQWDALKIAVTDGGEISPDDVAERGDWHPESVRRALRGIEELIDREYGKFALKNNHVAELIHSHVEDAVNDAKDATRNAVAASARALDALESDGLRERAKELAAWGARYGVEIDERDARLKVRIGRMEGKEWWEIVRDGLRAWRRAGNDPDRFRRGRVHYINADGYRVVGHVESAMRRAPGRALR